MIFDEGLTEERTEEKSFRANQPEEEDKQIVFVSPFLHCESTPTTHQNTIFIALGETERGREPGRAGGPGARSRQLGRGVVRRVGNGGGDASFTDERRERPASRPRARAAKRWPEMKKG